MNGIKLIGSKGGESKDCNTGRICRGGGGGGGWVWRCSGHNRIFTMESVLVGDFTKETDRHNLGKWGRSGNVILSGVGCNDQCGWREEGQKLPSWVIPFYLCMDRECEERKGVRETNEKQPCAYRWSYCHWLNAKAYSAVKTGL